VLDNCEHLVAECATLASELLAACPGLRILATSRETLGVAGEVVWEATPLSVAGVGAAGSEAVRLFVERVRLHDPRFEPTPARLEAIATLCARLDGIPLAIELAAARTRVLSVGQILSRLDDRFRLLGRSDRQSLHRQQTLRAAVDWSYDLLTDDERTLFERLSVFVGGCSLEAAEEVCSGDPVAPEDVLDLLARLADKSLVQVEERSGEARYRMLETIRQYSLERLRASGGEAGLRARHRDWFLRLADEADARVATPGEPTALARLDREHENLRAVLRRFADDAGETARLAHLCSILARYWEIYGHINEGWPWLERFAALADRIPAPVASRLLRNAGWAAKLRGRHPVAVELLERAVATGHAGGDTVGEARALSALAGTLELAGAFEQAWDAGVRSLELFEVAGYSAGVTSTLNQLGLMASDRGDLETSRMWYRRCLEISRELGDKRSCGIVLLNLGLAAWFLGELDEAEALALESRDLVREVGDRAIDARVWLLLGVVATERQCPDVAMSRFREALVGGRALGDFVTIVNGLEHAGTACVVAGEHALALRLAGSAATTREALSIVLPPSHQAKIDRYLERAREALGGEAADRAFAEGRALTTDDAIRLAFGE
jgi:predicted ATPase